MYNKQCLNSILIASCLLINSAHAGQFSTPLYTAPGALSWWEERNDLLPESTPQPWQGQTHYREPPPRPQKLYTPGVTIYPAAFPNTFNHHLSARQCKNIKHLQQADRCIMRTNANLAGLHEQIRYLNRENPRKKVARGWANVSNAALLETAKALLSRENGHRIKSFRQSFSMYEISSSKQADHGHFTGYFTPELQVQSHPDRHYRYPVYGPPSKKTHLSRSQIDNGALRHKGLEVAWTNDPVDLYFAQIQGSAIARYPDGSRRYLNYAGNNGYPYQEISRYLNERGYVSGGLSNSNIRHWLHQHPGKIKEVLHRNPRYIFFTLADETTRTATGTTMIPGHTVAVDDHYIPLGSVLLAEIPRINHRGERTGSDWRMLFAQDRGDAIKGPGRLDLYTGSGHTAEQRTYQLTGEHKTYLLVRKPDWNKLSAADM